MRGHGPAKGVALSLAAALLAAGAAQWAEARVAQAEGPRGFTVGVGREGDSALYQGVMEYSYQDLESSQSWEGPADDWAWHVAGVRDVFDQSARLRETTLLQTQLRHRHEGGLAPWGDEADHQVQEVYVDLETREAVARTTEAPLARRAIPLPLPATVPQPSSLEWSFLLSGPRFFQTWMVLDTGWLAIRDQGREFEVGERTTDLQSVLDRAGNDLYPPTERRAHAVVGAPARLGDATVWPLHVSTLLLYRGAADEHYASHQNWTFWFVDRQPYPVRLENELHDTGAWRQEDGDWFVYEERLARVYTLAHLVRGDGPALPWDAASHPGEPARLERASGSHPASGAEWRRYRVEDALTHVRENPALPAFSAWRARNPGSMLVGASFGGDYEQTVAVAPLSFDRPGVDVWRLTFAAPGGSTVFSVRSDRHASGLVVDRELGEAPIPEDARFSARDVPTSLITFAELARQWARQDPVRAAEPRWMGWGLPSAPVATAPAAFFLRNGWINFANENAAGTRVGSPGVTTGWSGVIANMSSGDVRYTWVNAPQADLFAPFRAGLVPETLVGSGAAPAPAPAPVLPAAVGATVLLVALLAWFAPLLHYSGVGLYTRLTRAALLDNVLRDQLARIIRERPGVSPPALQRATGAGWSTIVYHLGVLEKNGVVASVIDGRHRRFFPSGFADHSRLPALALLQNDMTRRVLDLVRARPGIDRNAVGRMLGMTAPGALWHLRRLESAGLVRRERVARAVGFYGVTAVPEEALPQQAPP